MKRLETYRSRWVSFLSMIPLLGVLLLPSGILSDTVLGQTVLKSGVIKVNDHIYQATGFGNTIMVVTSGGNVVIDTSIAMTAGKHKKMLQAVDSGPVKYIVLTHAHGDHIGGLQRWMGKDTQVVAQKNHVEFQHYQNRLAGFMALNSAAQFPQYAAFIKRRYSQLKKEGWPGNFNAAIKATILFEREYEFKLGDTRFVLYHTPGETYDHLSVWIPRYKAVHVGDNFYDSFPNMYTLRGTKPRWALDYTASIDKVIALKPEILVRAHGGPIYGKEKIAEILTRYRDSILYVHDATVKGMNEGKDVHTLMREIKLPKELFFGEGYGKIIWSIRGIYEGYAGWFDGNLSKMYDLPHEAVYPEVVELAGGADRITQKAEEHVERKDYPRALLLTDIALNAEPDNKKTLAVRLEALKKLKTLSGNSIEKGWLGNEINIIK
ncbi:MAG: MBL fold metallo-hydrolase, partial [Proteobacteria bacterium]|nr:MBL fold metallo-hydrolase [Pseudomonadota bacterium]